MRSGACLSRSFFFSRCLFMWRKVRNADRHLWELHTLNRHEKHDSSFCTIPYCCRGAKLVPFLEKSTKYRYVVRKKVVPLITECNIHCPSLLGFRLSGRDFLLHRCFQETLIMPVHTLCTKDFALKYASFPLTLLPYKERCQPV